MNFKRFISGVSALTIAASAFAGMAVTVNAADAVSVYERGTTTAWSASDVGAGEWVATGGTWSASETDGLHLELKSGGESATKSLSGLVKDSDIVQITGTWIAGGAPGRNGSYDYISLGEDIQIRAYEQDKKATVVINSAETSIDYTGRNETYTFDVTIDTAKKTVNSVTINSVGVIASEQSLTNGTVNSLTTGHYKAGGENYGINVYLKKIEVKTTAQAVSTADYTINYVAGDKTVYSVSSTGVIGQTVTAETVVMDEDGQRYYITDTTAPTFQIAANNNVWTVNVRAAENYTVKVVPSTDASKVIATGTVVEGDSYTYTYPMYLTDEDNKVVAKADATSYGATVTPTSNNQVFTVDYTAYTGTAYAVEAEDVITGVSHDGLSSWNLSSADAVRGFPNSAKTVLTVPESGKYKVTYAALGTNYGEGKGGTVALYKNSTEEENIINSVNVDYITTSAVRTTGTVSKEDVELRKGDTIVVLTSMSTGALDYVLIEKTGDLQEEPEVDTVEADPVGESHIDEESGKVYTPFKAIINTTPKSIKVTDVDGEEHDGTIDHMPTITDSDVEVGIIVIGLKKAAKVVFTVE